MKEMGQSLNRMTTTRAAVDADWRQFVLITEQVFRDFYDDIDTLCDALAVQMEAFKIPFAEGRIDHLRLINGIDRAVFDMMLAVKSGCIAPQANELWDRLIEAKIIRRTVRPNFVAHGDFEIDHVELSRHLDDRTLHNIFFPPAELFRRYRAMVVAVDVVDENGDLRRGSGFIVGHAQDLLGPSRNRPHVVITCRHNVDGKQLRSIQSESGRTIEVSNPILSETADIALFPIVDYFDEYPIALSGTVDVFDQVFTLGFPMVPRAQSTILGHRGEINAIVERYVEKDEVLVISNLVAPGSSGGPVLDSKGRCVGMTTSWLEAEYGAERTRFSVALPLAALQTELMRHGLHWW